jgi:hypothetical protein
MMTAGHAVTNRVTVTVLVWSLSLSHPLTQTRIGPQRLAATVLVRAAARRLGDTVSEHLEGWVMQYNIF